MIILGQYLIRGIPQEERQFPAALAGIIDCILTFGLTKIILMVVL